MLYEILQYSILTLICGYLVNYYARKDVSMHVKVWSVITWVLNFGLALLVPEDIYQTLKGQQDEEIRSRIGFEYLLLYWLVYLLTWTIIPVLQEWEDAADFQSKDRMKRSLKSNGIFYLYMIIGAIVGLIALILLNAGGQMGLITFLKCLATIWGILLQMVLMGYALVEIPKTMWRNANPNDYLQYLYHRVVQTSISVDEAIDDFKKVASYIAYLKKNSNDELILKYAQASNEMVPPQLKKFINQHIEKTLKDINYVKDYPVSLQSAIQHKRLMKRSIACWRRQEKALGDYIRQALFYEDIVQSIATGTTLKSLAKNTNSLENLWYCVIRHPFNKIFSVIIGLASIILLIAETQVFLTKDSSILALFLRIDNLQIIRFCAFLIMAFIIYMSNYSLFRLRLANLYGLYYKESDGASLMFATVNFSRIGVAIVLNFFDMIKMQNSIYATVMQAPKMGLLGEWVIKGLPGALWLIILCHFFNVWAWIADKLGMQDKLSFSSHQLLQSNKKRPVKVQQKRKQLEQDHSRAIMQFQQLEDM